MPFHGLNQYGRPIITPCAYRETRETRDAGAFNLAGATRLRLDVYVARVLVAAKRNGRKNDGRAIALRFWRVRDLR